MPGKVDLGNLALLSVRVTVIFAIILRKISANEKPNYAASWRTSDGSGMKWDAT
jgi:hypothetical protein